MMDDSPQAPTNAQPAEPEATDAALPEPEATDAAPPEERKDTPTAQPIAGLGVGRWERRRVLSAIGLQVALLLCMLLLSFFAAKIHGYDWPFPSAEDIANFDFVGASPDSPNPTFLAVAIEVLAWSAFGVLARSAFYVTRLVIEGVDFRVLQTVSKLIGDFAMGTSIATAVVALLRSTEFVSLSLKTASIDVVAAISFILGFYHENTRELLRSLSERVTFKASEPKDDET